MNRLVVLLVVLLAVGLLLTTSVAPVRAERLPGSATPVTPRSAPPRGHGPDASANVASASSSRQAGPPPFPTASPTAAATTYRSGLGTPNQSGVEYSGVPTNASNVSVEIQVPDDLPASTDLYSVGISLFDGADAYDQLGLANDNGSWQVFYADATACGTRPSAFWAAFPLARSATYLFDIGIEGGGVVLFDVRSSAGVDVWQETVHTGAVDLRLEPNQVCGTATVPGFTETESVYAAALGRPPYNFELRNASADGTLESDWQTLTSAASLGSVVRNGSNVTLLNEPFTLSFAPAEDNVSVETASYPQLLQTGVSLAFEGVSASPVALGAYALAPGWKLTATPSSDNVSFDSQLNILLPANIAPGSYLLGVEAANYSGLANRIALAIDVLPALTLAMGTQPATGELDANETGTFTPQATGGEPPYAYGWLELPSTCDLSPNGMAVCLFSDPGIYPLELGVADGLHYVHFVTINYTVRPDPRLELGSEVVTLGGELELRANLSGGIAPYTLSWRGLPAGCTTANSTAIACVPHASGLYTVSVVAVDQSGFRSSETVLVTVQVAAGGFVLTGGALGLTLVAVGLVVLIAGSAYVLYRRHFGQ